MRNCFTYALCAWAHQGGYLLIRRSLAYELFDGGSRPWWHCAWLTLLVPHFLHQAQDGRITQYAPRPETVEKHRESMWRFWLALFWLDGEIVEGDRAICLRQKRE